MGVAYDKLHVFQEFWIPGPLVSTHKQILTLKEYIAICGMYYEASKCTGVTIVWGIMCRQQGGARYGRA